MQVYYDSVDFLESIEQASTMSDEEATKKYRHAIDLYRGDFLSGLKMEWAIERRQALKGAYAQALIALGRIRKSQGHNEEALGYFLRALHETPEREDIHREVMSLYAAMGRNEDAKAQYRRLAAELEADLGITPSRESRELYESIS
jgi:two-component SAPR family response regulator